jgi:plasmid stabilization system protein ParE
VSGGYRLGDSARSQIAEILAKSEYEYGSVHADRYRALIEAAILAVVSRPERPAASPAAEYPGAWVYDLRFARNLVPVKRRIRNPWHKLVYRVAEDGAIEIIAVIGRSYPADRAVREALPR